MAVSIVGFLGAICWIGGAVHDLGSSTHLFELGCLATAALALVGHDRRESFGRFRQIEQLWGSMLCVFLAPSNDTASLWTGIYSDGPRSIAKQGKATKMRQEQPKPVRTTFITIENTKQ
jgi:hypothetical protein